MTDESGLIRNLHTAIRRYIMERMNSFDQLKPETGGVFTLSSALNEQNAFMEVMPRIFFLNAIRWELAAINPETLTTQTEMRELLDVAAQIALDHALGAVSDSIAENSVRREYQAFSTYMHLLSTETLQSVDPLPFHRALSKQEQVDLLVAFGKRWGVEVADGWFTRDYYPVIPRSSILLSNTLVVEAFDAEALVEMNGTNIVQRILNAQGIQRIYIFEESYPGIECEISNLDLAMAIPHIVDFSFSESLDWMMYTSWHGTVTIGGEWLLNAVKDEWPDWETHVREYFDAEQMSDEDDTI